jgi:GTPase-activating protein SAC7
MTSEFPPSSSSQQPFATPQPAPVSAASQATSPPTKQSLKSWWKGFRPPTKSHDTPGKYLSHRKTSQTQKYFVSDSFVSRVPKHRGPLFQENPMNGNVSIIDGLPLEVVSRASPIRQTCRPTPNRRISFQDFRHRYNSVRRSSSFLGGPKKSLGLQRHMSEASPASVRHAMQRSPTPSTPQENRFGQNHTFTADNSSESTLLDAGILPGPKTRPLSHFFRGLSFSRLGSSSSEESAKQNLKAAEQPTGIFGVPLRQSITYANVAISLVDAEGKSYIYGYVPIVVAKCGVYLKEKGSCFLNVSAECRANKVHSDQR